MRHYSHFLILIAAVTLIALPGCKDPKEQEGNFTVNVAPYVGNQPLALQTTYTDGTGNEFYVTKLKFYLSHIKLVKADNSEVKITSAAFYDAGDNNWKAFKGKADNGTYKAIKFNVGLDAAQNATDPADYGEEEALGPKDDMFWEWLKHRFIILEGRADTAGQSFTNSKGLAYHVGTDATLRSVTLTGNDIVVDGDKAITLKVDLLKVFLDQPAPVNMITQPATQSEAGDIAIANQFADQFSKAFAYTE